MSLSLTNLLNQIGIIWCRSALYLILGFLVAGTLYIWIRPSLIQQHQCGGDRSMAETGGSGDSPERGSGSCLRIQYSCGIR